MGDVVQLFKKKLTDDENKEMIIDNLKNIHHGKWVNIWCAVRNVESIELGHKFLNVLLEENKVEIQLVPLNGTPVAALYRYNSFNDLID